ncbi:MAG: four helix bundle protein [Chryseolinea sp.]
MAEGSTKKSEMDYKRFIEIALGSSFELETRILTIEEQKWFPEKTVGGLLFKIRTKNVKCFFEQTMSDKSPAEEISLQSFLRESLMTSSACGLPLFRR